MVYLCILVLVLFIFVSSDFLDTPIAFAIFWIQIDIQLFQSPSLSLFLPMTLLHGAFIIRIHLALYSHIATLVARIFLRVSLTASRSLRLVGLNTSSLSLSGRFVP